MRKVQNEYIDYKILASHFTKSDESMRQLLRKYEKGEPSFWLIYVKAYNFDKGFKKC